GRVINLDGQNFTVVGVMPRGFAFPNEETQLWVPLGEALRSAPQLEFNRHFYAFESVARLAVGATLAGARADVGVVAQRISAAERRKEVAGRGALGAERARLARQLLTESVVVALIAGAAGVLLARWGLAAVLAVWPRVPRVNEIGLDPWVLGFALVVSLVTGLA